MGILADIQIINNNLVEKAIWRKISEKNGHKIMSYGLEPHGYTMTLSPDVPLHVTTDQEERQFVYIDSMQSVKLKCNERLQMLDNVVGFLYPKSSYSRHGLIYSLAVVDAGFNGHISFSIFNPTDTWHKLYINEGILQIVFHESDVKPNSIYTGQYNEK